MAQFSQEKVNYLRLIRTENIGPITFYKLLNRFGSASAAIDALPDLSNRGKRAKPLVAFEQSKAEDEIAELEKLGGHLITQYEPEYPQPLVEVEDAPPVLSVLGNLDFLNQQCFAIVGARNASVNGLNLARNLSKPIGEAGYKIVSGLARGIDTQAHTVSLNTGTIAVVAGGVDVIYPPENTDLYHKIIEQGAIIAEAPLGTQPQARHFPRRNRIISGLSRGVLVIEAALKSGSLITARMAAEQGRDVFAIPGSPSDPRSYGTNNLLKDGAHLVTRPEDILDILNTYSLKPFEQKLSQTSFEFDETSGLDEYQPEDVNSKPEEIQNTILEKLNYSPIQIDELIRSCHCPAQDVLSSLLELELAGKIERHPGNQVNLI